MESALTCRLQTGAFGPLAQAKELTEPFPTYTVTVRLTEVGSEASPTR